jgi:hypothetical protein
VLAAVTLIPLWPQFTVFPQESLIKAEPFSAPFRIENTGFVPVHVDDVVHEAKLGPVNIARSSTRGAGWSDFRLKRGESKAIISNFANTIPNSADLAVVIDYRPVAFVPFTLRRYFRFVGAYGDNWQWLQQPSADIEEDADKQVDAHPRRLYESR